MQKASQPLTLDPSPQPMSKVTIVHRFFGVGDAKSCPTLNPHPGFTLDPNPSADAKSFLLHQSFQPIDAKRHTGAPLILVADAKSVPHPKSDSMQKASLTLNRWQKLCWCFCLFISRC
ncbi:hypothetical protein M5689_000559 [Euphorbia peplus]|nr:hypothetical protein M5689_000559 [Euphorbia peplus]